MSAVIIHPALRGRIEATAEVETAIKSSNTDELIRLDPEDTQKVHEKGRLRMENVGKGRRYPRFSDKTYLHRWLLDAPRNKQVDHINGDPRDNRRSNLRLATNRQNQWNQGSMRNSVSKYKGVGWCRRTESWQVAIKEGDSTVFIGRFGDEVEAAKAYDERARALHGEYGRYNFPREGERSAVRVDT